MTSILSNPESILIAKWLGILFCISQSAMFSGLNLAYFSISRLRLEVEASAGNTAVLPILAMRKDSNFLLTTILWGNVSINVLLTLLTNSVMAGAFAFVFSTLFITLFGEIFPQAYFSRHAISVGARLAPVLRLYQFLLFPVAKPLALLLDVWPGKDRIQYFRERDMREMIHKHMSSVESDLGKIEGHGALNFFAIDDSLAADEGEPLDPRSIIRMRFTNNTPVFPPPGSDENAVFLKKLQAAGKKWSVLIDDKDDPRILLDTDGYLRSALLEVETFDPQKYCHRPIVIRDPSTRLGHVLPKLEVNPDYKGDNVIDRDVILVWTGVRRVITGADILGRLLAGIARTQESRP